MTRPTTTAPPGGRASARRRRATTGSRARASTTTRLAWAGAAASLQNTLGIQWAGPRYDRGDEVGYAGVTVGDVLPESQAEQLGVRVGSRAVAIVGRAMRFFFVEDVEAALNAALAAHPKGVTMRFMAPREAGTDAIGSGGST